MFKTSIEWTDATWSPLRARVKENAAEIAKAKGYTSLIPIAEKMAGHVGPHCEHVSEGCKHCYSGTDNHRCLPKNGTGLPFDRRSRDLIDPIVDEKILEWPLYWKKPRRVFVENQSDLYGEWVYANDQADAYAVMAYCYWHWFQVLTKRPERRLDAFNDPMFAREVEDRFRRRVALEGTASARFQWPLPNVWEGVSCEDQPTADDRITLLLQTPAALRFVSYEPALGPLTFRWAKWDDGLPHPRRLDNSPSVQRGGKTLAGCIDHLDGHRMLDWVIAGGESGAGARPAHPEWFRDVRDQCQAAGVPYFFKQWGAWTPESTQVRHKIRLTSAGRNGSDLANAQDGGDVWMSRVGKKAAGALLDGREWREFPIAQSAVVGAKEPRS